MQLDPDFYQLIRLEAPSFCHMQEKWTVWTTKSLIVVNDVCGSNMNWKLYSLRAESLQCALFGIPWKTTWNHQSEQNAVDLSVIKSSESAEGLEVWTTLASCMLSAAVHSIRFHLEILICWAPRYLWYHQSEYLYLKGNLRTKQSLE